MPNITSEELHLIIFQAFGGIFFILDKKIGKNSSPFNTDEKRRNLVNKVLELIKEEIAEHTGKEVVDLGDKCDEICGKIDRMDRVLWHSQVAVLDAVQHISKEMKTLRSDMAEAVKNTMLEPIVVCVQIFPRKILL